MRRHGARARARQAVVHTAIAAASHEFKRKNLYANTARCSMTVREMVTADGSRFRTVTFDPTGRHAQQRVRDYMERFGC